MSRPVSRRMAALAACLLALAGPGVASPHRPSPPPPPPPGSPVVPFAPSSRIDLITAAEAGLPDARGSEPVAPLGLQGPDISLAAPAGAVTAPFDLEIRFAPHLGDVDVSSVRVTYVKAPTVDLTPRLLAASAISPQGIVLHGVQMPPGRHTLRILVADVHGFTSMLDVVLTVLAK